MVFIWNVRWYIWIMSTFNLAIRKILLIFRGCEQLFFGKKIPQCINYYTAANSIQNLWASQSYVTMMYLLPNWKTELPPSYRSSYFLNTPPVLHFKFLIYLVSRHAIFSFKYSCERAVFLCDLILPPEFFLLQKFSE